MGCARGREGGTGLLEGTDGAIPMLGPSIFMGLGGGSGSGGGGSEGSGVGDASTLGPGIEGAVGAPMLTIDVSSPGCAA